MSLLIDYAPLRDRIKFTFVQGYTTLVQFLSQIALEIRFQ